MPACSVNGLNIGYDLRGDGPVVMLVSGTGAARGDWIPEAVDVLAERFTVLTYDHRGTGETGGSEGLYSTRQFAADAVGLLQGLGIESAHVMGHSMGGRVAQWMALDAPERVRTLVLASSGPGEYPGQFEDGRGMMRGIPLRAAMIMINEGYEAWIEHYIRESMLTRRFQEDQRERADALVRRALNDAPPVEDYLKHTIARQQHQSAERLQEITMPALVIIGDADRDVGGTGNHFAQSEYLAETLPNATFHVLPGLQHGFYWERPQETMAVVGDWLDTQEARRGEQEASIGGGAR
jgi:pimeloyl-ACP methyl ester carboxylesterase